MFKGIESRGMLWFLAWGARAHGIPGLRLLARTVVPLPLPLPVRPEASNRSLA